eukprot:GHVS01027922.1.p1 GENE.GHVS01027922.1~~GHVS01027922.1.p1  ORF type:complete len:322 (+),score=72.72 GHVS01027922.1:544-1509(+)
MVCCSSSAAVMHSERFSRHNRAFLVLLCFVLSVLHTSLSFVDASSIVVSSVSEERVCYGFAKAEYEEGSVDGVCACEVKPCEDGSNEKDKEEEEVVVNGEEQNVESINDGKSRRQLVDEVDLVVVQSDLISDDASSDETATNEKYETESGEPKLFYERGICLLFAQINTGCSLPNEPTSRRLRSSVLPAIQQTTTYATRQLEAEESVEDIESEIGSITAAPHSNVDSDSAADDNVETKEEEQIKNVDKLLSLSLREVLQDPMPFAPTIAKFAEDVFQGQSENAQRFGPGLWKLFEAVTAQFGGDGEIDMSALLGGGGALTT